MKEEIDGVMLLQAKERQGRQQTPRSWRGTQTRFSVTDSEGSSPADPLILDFQPPDSERTNFCCSSHLVYSALLLQPQGLD